MSLVTWQPRTTTQRVEVVYVCVNRYKAVVRFKLSTVTHSDVLILYNCVSCAGRKMDDGSNPHRIFVERTLAIIKPDAVHKSEEIEDIIFRSGFTVLQVRFIF